jgi:ABC-type proline/glycine betaine transport system ATPase subunit
MADRIAILDMGANVEQLDTPAEILRAPGSDFVEAFVGEERGLRRLGLIPVSAIDLAPPPGTDALPRVAETDSLRFALDAIVIAGTDAAVVVDAEGRPKGTLTLSRLGEEVGEVEDA